MATRTYPLLVIPDNPTDANFEVDFRSNTESLMTAVKSIDTEVSDGRGSTVSLSARLASALNADGSLKTTAPTGGFWTEETAIASALSGQSIFTVTGNKTATYEENRALQIVSTDTVYAHVTSSSYNAGTGVTTIGLTAPIGAGTVANIFFASQPRQNLPSDLGSSSTSSSSGGTSTGSSASIDTISKVLDLTNLVDGYLYDTSNDSDTGDWITSATTQSWYIEGSKTSTGTATRSTTLAFPRVAIIAATTTTIRIYDATDNSLPLWIQISQGSGTTSSALGPETNATITSVHAHNGYIYVGCTGTAGGVHILDFINDEVWVIDPLGVFRTNLSIENRQNVPVLSRVGTHVLNGANVKSITTTVLSATTTDAIRGLQDPELLVSTTNGLCIKRASSGAIFDLTKTGGDDYINAEFLSDGDVIGVNQTGGSVDAFATYDIDSTSPNRSYSTSVSPGLLNYPNSTFTKEQVTVAANNDIYIAATNGVTRLRERQTDYTKGWSAYITADYSTGWMAGDIRLSALADADATPDGRTDRSRRANDLTVTGTIISSNVATGAECRAFSSYSAANYYHQTYSSNLDFDANTDFYVMTWIFLTTGGSNEETIMVRGEWDQTLNGGSGAYTGSAYSLVISATGKVEFKISNNGFSSVDSITTDNSFNDARWHQVVGFCDRSNGSMKVYVDGHSAADSVSIVNAQQTMVSSSATLHVGITAGSTAALDNGYLSLFRIGACFLPPEDMLEIYRDEREIFTDNADCTLPQTSSICTSIENDDTTGTITVSTSQAIANFNGFLRTYGDTANVNYYSLPGIYISDGNALYIDNTNGKLYITLPAINLREELKGIIQTVTASASGTTGGTTGGGTSSTTGSAAEVRFFGLTYDSLTGMLKIESGDGNLDVAAYDAWYIAGGNSTFSLDTSGNLMLGVTGGTGTGIGSTISGLSGQPPSYIW